MEGLKRKVSSTRENGTSECSVERMTALECSKSVKTAVVKRRGKQKENGETIHIEVSDSSDNSCGSFGGLRFAGVVGTFARKHKHGRQ